MEIRLRDLANPYTDPGQIVLAGPGYSALPAAISLAEFKRFLGIAASVTADDELLTSYLLSVINEMRQPTSLGVAFSELKCTIRVIFGDKRIVHLPLLRSTTDLLAGDFDEDGNIGLASHWKRVPSFMTTYNLPLFTTDVATLPYGCLLYTSDAADE